MRKKARWKQIRQWKYCPTCNGKLTEECAICRQHICLFCETGTYQYNTDWAGLIHKTCLITNSTELQEINIDTISNLPYWEKMKVLTTRKDWLKRQRKQDRKDLRRQETKKWNMQWISKGLCPFCKEHEPIFKHESCLHCYGIRIKSSRKQKNKMKVKKK